MSRTVQFPEHEFDLENVALECARSLLQLEAGSIREVAREAARKAPIRLKEVDVVDATAAAVGALQLEARVFDALRAEIGEERFQRERFREGLSIMSVVEDALCHVECDIVDEAVEERVRELSEPDGVPIVKPVSCQD